MTVIIATNKIVELRICLNFPRSPEEIAIPIGLFIPSDMSTTAMVAMMSTKAATEEATPIASAPTIFAVTNQKR
jgi:hypothetical protein